MTCKTEAMNLKKIKNDFDNLRIALHCSKCSLKVYFFLELDLKDQKKYVRPIILLIMMVTLLVIIYIMKILIVILKVVIKLL